MIITTDAMKGGVGKSVISRMVMHHFLEAGENPLLIETDSSNPDVALCFAKKAFNGQPCEVITCNLNLESGWVAMQEAALRAHEEGRPTVINAKAGNRDSVLKYGESLTEICQAAEMDLVTLWPVDRDAMCLNQLGSYLDVIRGRVCIVKNLRFAEEEDKSRFDFIAGTKMNGFDMGEIPSVFFPRLPEFVMDELKAPKFRAIHELNESLGLVQRCMSKKVLGEAAAAVAQALEIAAPATKAA